MVGRPAPPRAGERRLTRRDDDLAGLAEHVGRKLPHVGAGDVHLGNCAVLLALDVLCAAVALGPFELPELGVEAKIIGGLCPCGHRHRGCCVFDPPSAAGPCCAPAVGRLEMPESADSWRRWYCAAHWPAFREAAADFGLVAVVLAGGAS